jgi:acyl-CoA synthetase (NDP forming)
LIAAAAHDKKKTTHCGEEYVMTTTTDLIQRARSAGRVLLTEVEAKTVLAAAGVPIVQTRLARTPEEAVKLAREIGFPVVLKIVSPQIVHKSDIGGVKLGLASAQEVETAFAAIAAATRRAEPQAAIDGVSVQPLAKPGVEVIIGAITDPQFGPTLMFGLGGVHVEVLKDVAFRLAPLTPRDAQQMLQEIKGLPLLQGHRGQPPVNLEALEKTLLQVSHLLETHPEIKELDLNPLFAYPDGCLAVDARIVLKEPGSNPQLLTPNIDLQQAFARAFNPRTVAVVGDKKAMGYMWLRSQSTFTGKVYSVQIDEQEIPGITALGVPNFRSLAEIPDEIDYVIGAVPRQIVPRIVTDAVAKKVGGMMFFTSGFSEVGDELGIKLEKEATQIARQGGLALIGPNCMGIYNPKLGLRNYPDLLAGEEGNVGFIGQSGTHTITFSLTAPTRGVKISKAVSFGNAAVLDVADYLEYFAQDEQTKIIGMYLEGVRQGRRFFSLLREITPKKPVVIWKGGKAEGGQRAISSHTGSLATSPAVWEAMVRQAGAISVTTFDELLDAIQLLLFAKPTTGSGVGLIAMTGGPSVVITDAFESAGLEVPVLTESSYAELATFFTVVGGSYRNPLDSGHTIGMGLATTNLERLFDILDRDAHISAIVMDTGAGLMAGRWREHPENLMALLNTCATFAQRSAKPFLTILQPFAFEASLVEVREKFHQRGIATFPNHERAAWALRRVIDYWRGN